MKAGTRAPDINPPGALWLNVAEPLTLDKLKGKLVILDFWTLGCINCIHVIPTLDKVQKAFPDDVTIISIHSPKFENEKNPDSVRAAMARYGITHPVVQDAEMKLWHAYGINAWPTLVFISPDGQIIGSNAGEPDADRLVDFVGRKLAEYKEAGQIVPGAINLAPMAALPQAGNFKFPAKIRSLGSDWILADTDHHQIVLLDAQGKVLRRFGSGQAGFADGPAEAATFTRPQGVAGEGQTIYVADTGNHALRKIDLVTGEVSTLAGTGQRGGSLSFRARGGKDTALASPWDVLPVGDVLYFANAGTHQLGVEDLKTGDVAAFSGSSAEGLQDGPASQAAMAQPSGLAFSADGKTLYVADSESSAIRAMTLGPKPIVETFVGQGLFDFGHVNGPFKQALLQHALGVAILPDGNLVVADTYNSVLRFLDLKTRTVSDFGADFACQIDTGCKLSEPAGVWMEDASRLLVSDTNNHRILAYDLGAKTITVWAQ